MGTMPQVRLPIGPLLEATGVEHSRTEDMHAAPNPITALNLLTGKPLASLHRWCRQGVPIHTADELAVACGFHPANVWPEWWEACFEQGELEREREAKKQVTVLVRRERRRLRHLRVVA